MEKLTKSQIRFPINTEETIDRVLALQILAAIFLGERSLAAQGLKRLHNKCLDNKQLLKVKQSLDEEFNEKFICSIDDRLHLWMKECCNTTCVLDTSIELTNFSSILTDIQLNRFHFVLSLNIKKVKRDKNDFRDMPSNDVDLKRQKKVLAEINEKQVKEFKLRIGENGTLCSGERHRKDPCYQLVQSLV